MVVFPFHQASIQPIPFMMRETFLFMDYVFAAVSACNFLTSLWLKVIFSLKTSGSTLFTATSSKLLSGWSRMTGCIFFF
jgi:hypothetical protein